jgi:LacI family transcriptional regulator
MPTIYDVAERAGVAPVTVSRVINGSDYVRDETRVRVQQAIADLGYTPNRLARGLRSKRTQTLGLVVTDITNPFWTTVARGVEDAASEHGFSVILCNTDESEAKQEQYVNLLLEKQIDGFLLVPATDEVSAIALVQERGVPVVVLDRHVSLPVDVVRCDSEGGAYDLVTHLLELGHRRIALLGGSPAVSTAQDRVDGYRRALSEAGVPIDETLVLHRDYTQESGYAMTESILRLPDRPTALFAVNNFIAIGAVRALREAGLRIPEDMALVGFDDLPLALVVEPFLTVAAQPAYEMGARATEHLLTRIDGDDVAAPIEVILPTELIVRRSSGVGITTAVEV